jgi:hypothetical protein
LPPHSQQPANDPYPEPGESNPSPQDPFWSHHPIYVLVCVLNKLLLCSYR